MVEGTTSTRAAGQVDELEVARRERRAREDLVVRFLPLALAVAARHRTGSRPIDDEVLSAACLGLVRAAERYAGGELFAGFAVPFIEAAVAARRVDRVHGFRGGTRAEQAAAARSLVVRLLAEQEHTRELAGDLGLDRRLVAAGLLQATARNAVPVYAAPAA
jgi:DNA-directed RNA polymerase specialized sigma subunit